MGTTNRLAKFAEICIVCTCLYGHQEFSHHKFIGLGTKQGFPCNITDPVIRLIMKLTHYSDLGLRLLMYLTMRYGETVTIQEVSVRFGVSKNHMVKISHQLTKSGMIESSRGRNGGLRLAAPPGKISVEEALLATEDNFDLVECFGADNHCVITDVCKLSGVLDDAREAFFRVLRQVSLSDLVKNKRRLEGSLLPFSEPAIVKFYSRSTSTPKRKAKKTA